MSRPQFPAKARTPEQVEHRLIIHDFLRRDQCHQDDASFASIHHIVGMVAQVYSAFAAHDGGIRVGGAHLIIGDPLIIAAFHLTVLRSSSKLDMSLSTHPAPLSPGLFPRYDVSDRGNVGG